MRLTFAPYMKKKRILVSPLNWGLGHATRCIPIINALRAEGYEPVIGTSGRALYLLQQEFPELDFIHLPDYNISYQKKGSFALKILQSAPTIIKKINEEQGRLKELIKANKIDGVISDNRFGLYSNEVPCVFLTHQVMIKAPVGEKILYKFNQKFIQKYDECWIPDFAGPENLSGDLAHRFPTEGSYKYIGPLSRFQVREAKKEPQFQVLALISGPEPQRTLFEEIVVNQMMELGLQGAVVRGITEQQKIEERDGIHFYNYCTGSELEGLLHDSEIVVSRSGYSTIMDLCVSGKKAIFCPTPGQTEQEYLAVELDKKKHAPFYTQNDFDLKSALIKSIDYTGLPKFDQQEIDWKGCFSLFEG